LTSMILGMVSGIIIARVLGPEKRGYFGLVVMACTLLFTLGHLGTGSAIAYYTGKRIYDRKKILKFLAVSALTLGTAVSIIFYFTYGFFGQIWTDIPKAIMLIGLVSVPFAYLYHFLDRFLLAALRVKQANIARVLYSFIYLVLIVIFIWVLKGSIKETVVVYTVSFIAASTLTFFLFTGNFRPMGKLDLSLSGPFLDYGIRAYLIVIFNFLNYKIGIILVKHYLTVSDVSFFQIAGGIAQRLWYIPNAMSILLFPTLMAMKKGSAGFSAKISRNNLFFMVILAIVALFITKPAVLFLYGSEYEMVTYAILALLPGIVIFPFYKFLAAYFAAERKLEICILASITGIVVNVGANIILIPRFGIVGAGLASSISYSVLSSILLLFFRFQTKIPFREIFIPTKDDFMTYLNGIRKVRQKIRRRFSRDNDQNTT